MQVIITKNGKLMTVSMSAFHNFYENAGWVIANASVANPVDVEPVVTNDNTDVEPEQEAEEEWSDEEWNEEEEPQDIEKPLSEMNRDELVAKANALGVDISDCTSNKQIRERIRNYSK